MALWFGLAALLDPPSLRWAMAAEDSPPDVDMVDRAEAARRGAAEGRIDPAQLYSVLDSSLAPAPGADNPTGSEPLPLHTHSSLWFPYARDLARADPRESGEIQPHHLLRAVLEHPEGSTVALLAQLGTTPRAMIGALDAPRPGSPQVAPPASTAGLAEGLCEVAIVRIPVDAKRFDSLVVRLERRLLPSPPTIRAWHADAN